MFQCLLCIHSRLGLQWNSSGCVVVAAVLLPCCLVNWNASCWLSLAAEQQQLSPLLQWPFGTLPWRNPRAHAPSSSTHPQGLSPQPLGAPPRLPFACDTHHWHLHSPCGTSSGCCSVVPHPLPVAVAAVMPQGITSLHRLTPTTQWHSHQPLPPPSMAHSCDRAWAAMVHWGCCRWSERVDGLHQPLLLQCYPGSCSS